MRYLSTAILCALLSLTSGCGGWTHIEDYPCPNPNGTTKITYTNFVKRFLENWCNHCHSSSSPNRRGAPVTYIFDAYEYRSYPALWKALSAG